jgi:hypothetical protein
MLTDHWLVRAIADGSAIAQPPAPAAIAPPKVSVVPADDAFTLPTRKFNFSD